MAARSIELFLIALVAITGCSGCRSLRAGRQTKSLATARHLSLLGTDKLQQNRYNDAELLFQKALRHSDADERAHKGMAEVLWQQAERSQAVEHMSTAVEISGDNPELLVRLGEMHFAEGRYEEAIEQADAALNVQRKYSEAWALRGKVLHQLGRFDDAMESYHRALNEQSDYPEIQLALAEIYQSLGRSQRALHTLKRMLDVPERTAPAKAWLLRGQALADLGEPAEARLCFHEASKCADESETALLVELAKSQIRFGDLAAARQCIGRAMLHDPYNQQVLDVKSSLDSAFREYETKSALVGYGRPAEETEETPRKLP